MKDVKVVAMYLPQFHRTEENDKWWGEGFTDWVAVKEAEPVFEGHIQPREPLNDNYYNLMDREVMQWQAKLAKKYNVYGFCFYHYWFKKGQKLLEKPAENLLNWKDIDMKFCFSWANVTWARTWSKITAKNEWSPKYDGEKYKGNDDIGILAEQKYGRENDWKNHFDYLLPFFKDERYIKIDGKPVFVIYRAQDIPALQPMLRMWNKLAYTNGIPGIYIIAEYCDAYSSEISACMRHEPELSRGIVRNQSLNRDKGVITIDYEKLYNVALSEKKENPFGKKYLMCFTDFDNTPRKGKNGEVLTGVSLDKFEEYFDTVVSRSEEWGNSLLFINAWNEWGEGMYLEPDKKNGFGYLERIKIVLQRHNDLSPKKIEKSIMKPAQSSVNAKCLDKWLCIKEDGKSILDYLYELKCDSIAIYGYGILGRHLLTELENSDLVVKYIIDRKLVGKVKDIEVVKPEDNLPAVDAIIVTPVWDFNEIEGYLSSKCDCKILSLAEILNETY